MSARVAKLEGELRETQATIQQCVVTIVAASFVAQALGSVLAAQVEDGSFPSLAALLAKLDTHTTTLMRRFEDVARGD